MVDISNNKWTELDGGNISASPDGVQGGYQPSTLAPIIRSIRGAVKREYVSANPVYASSGSANTYAIAFATPLEIAKGKRIAFFANVTNTGASTINLNGTGAVAIVRVDGTALQAGDIRAGYPVDLLYDGTRYILQSAVNLSNYSGTITATAFTGSGAALTALNATNLTTGTVNNARLPIIDDAKLPSTMSSKTINGDLVVKSAIYVDNPTYRQINFRNSTGATQSSIISNGDDGSLILRLNNDAGTMVRDFKIPRTGNATIGTDVVWTSGNSGAGSGLNADLLDGQHGAYYLARANGTGTQAISTVAGLQAAIDAQVTKAGDTMTGALGVAVALGTGTTTNALVAVRNTQNGDAIITMGANNRTASLSTIGQRANGNTFISTNTAIWELRTDKHIYLPDGGRLLSNGDVYNTTYSTNLTTIINRSSNVRLSREQYQSVNVNGWNNVPAGAVITGLYRGGNGQIEGMNYRYIHQTDINGTWQFIPIEP